MELKLYMSDYNKNYSPKFYIRDNYSKVNSIKY